MKKPPSTVPVAEPSPAAPPQYFTGIDYHKRYSVYCVLNAAGKVQARGRIEHATPDEFGTLVKQWPGGWSSRLP